VRENWRLALLDPEMTEGINGNGHLIQQYYYGICAPEKSGN
jgi:hypothetical protein